jgi:uncharacterized protein (DUF952 family)
LSEEGFIHCSDPRQLEGVANRLFRGRSELVLLIIDPERLGGEVRWENLEGGDELFPHIYGAIEIAAVLDVRSFVPGSDGRFVLPPDLRGLPE